MTFSQLKVYSRYTNQVKKVIFKLWAILAVGSKEGGVPSVWLRNCTTASVQDISGHDDVAWKQSIQSCPEKAGVIQNWGPHNFVEYGEAKGLEGM